MKQIYLDYNATFPTRTELFQKLLQNTASYGNPSSIHSFGRKARQTIEDTRHKLAKKLHVTPDKIIFTSGGTEANNMVLKGFFRETVNPNIAVLATEHPSVLQTATFLWGQSLHLLPVLKSGVVDLNHLEDFLQNSKTPSLVSIMYANNETGVIQPIAEIASLVHRYQSLLHCDAVQAFGKIPLHFKDDRPDFITLSGHKIGALQGVGALICLNNFSYEALVIGGGQEKGRRSGTENVLGVSSLGLALDSYDNDISKESQIRELRDYLEAKLLKIDPTIMFFGKDAERLPNTCSFASSGLLSETQVIGLDLEGFAISAGSACSSGKTKRSHVICAMGTCEIYANAAIRVSLGPDTTQDEIDAFIKAWEKIYLHNSESKKEARG